jgi:hypothetical protein
VIPARNGRRKRSTSRAEHPAAARASRAEVSGRPVSSRPAAPAPSATGAGPGPGGRPAWRRARAPGWRRGAPAGVRHADEAALGPHERAGIERPQVERVVVQDARGLGVAREQDLEAAVQEEAVHLVRPHPPAHAVGPLEHDGVHAAGLQLAGGGQARQAGTHDDDGSAIGHRGDYGLGAGALTPSGAVTPAR